MIKVTLKGLAARPVRTLLSALAIVVGVAFVFAALTLTDAMRGAADSLSSAAYDGTDAVVTAKTTFQPSSDGWGETPALPVSTLDQVRRAPGVEVAVGDITTDTAQIIDRKGKPVGDGPYFGSGFDARTPGAERLTPFRLQDGRWATGPGEVVIDQGTAEKQDYAVGGTVKVATSGEAKEFEIVGVATFADVKSIGTATFAVFDLEQAQTLFAKHGYDRILVAGDRRAGGGGRRRHADPVGRGRRPLRPRRPERLRRHPAHDPARLRRRGDGRGRVHDLQRALDRRRPADA